MGTDKGSCSIEEVRYVLQRDHTLLFNQNVNSVTASIKVSHLCLHQIFVTAIIGTEVSPIMALLPFSQFSRSECHFQQNNGPFSIGNRQDLFLVGTDKVYENVISFPIGPSTPKNSA